MLCDCFVGISRSHSIWEPTKAKAKAKDIFILSNNPIMK